MDINTFKYYKTWFDNYVNSFYSKDEFTNKNITLKINHTKRVVENSKIISHHLGLSKEHSMTTEIAALFHDIGRFEQFKIYKTFNDSISEDHSTLGIKVLNQNNILDKIDKKEKNIILDAIYYHNKFQLPQLDTTYKEKTCKITRDSDKLDIFKVVTDYYSIRFTDPNPAIEHDLQESNEYSTNIVEDIFKCENSKFEYIKNCNDSRLMKLTWIFDIYFPITLSLVKEREYIQKSINALPNTPEITKIEKHLLSFIDKKASY